MIDSEYKYYSQEKMFHGFIPHVMGTKFDLLVLTNESEQFLSFWNEVVDKFNVLDSILNRFNPSSEISAINQSPANEWVEVSDLMLSIIQSCASYYLLTFHLFDVTMHDFSLVEIDADNKRIKRGDENNHFDFGGFAKGYALTKVCDIVTAAGIENGFINFGNSTIVGIGHHPYGDCWKVSLPHPNNSDTSLAEFSLHDSALSTSGNTSQHTGHIFNTILGKYEESSKVTTIEAQNALDAEVLSTVWMIADDMQRREIAKNFKGIIGNVFTT